MVVPRMQMAVIAILTAVTWIEMQVEEGEMAPEVVGESGGAS